jgi:hypothetical protein
MKLDGPVAAPAPTTPAEPNAKKLRAEVADTPVPLKVEPAGKAPGRTLITMLRTREEAAVLKQASFAFAEKKLARSKRADIMAAFPDIKTPELKLGVARAFENYVYRSLLLLKDQQPQEVSATPVQWDRT